MASTHIEISGNGRLNGKLRAMVDNIRRCQQQIDEAKETYDQLAAGADWEALATALGLDPETECADAETIYNLIGSVQTELNAANIGQLLGRLG